MLVKQIPNRPDYLVSENCDVFSKKWGRIRKLKPANHRQGYLLINLYTNGKRKLESGHRLVLMAFDRMPKDGEVARHLDGNLHNNHISNLRWGTSQENSYDRDKIHKTGKLPDNSNEKNPMCKLSDKQVQEVRKLSRTGKFTQRCLAEKYNVCQSQISLIVNNKLRAVK